MSAESGHSVVARLGPEGLQWGGTLMSAESVLRAEEVDSVLSLQWGGTLMSAESPRSTIAPRGSGALQWGGTLMSAESSGFRLPRGPRSLGFNGAAL